MPHQRARYASSRLSKMLSFSPIVGIFGHRQVGKTTLVTQHGGDYVSLDQRSTLLAADKDPEGFIEQFNKFPVVIDECQLCPGIFPALKERVRINNKPGQFLLTGSVRFTSRKAVRESLTGRIVKIDLLPMGITEIAQKSLNDRLIRFLKGNLSDKSDALTKTHVLDRTHQVYLDRGGLPGVCFVRDPQVRLQKFEDQLETMLDRDLRLIVDTSLPFETLLNLIRFLARQQSQPLDWTEVARNTRISKPTLKRLFYALESMYLLRIIPSEGDVKKPTFFFEDQGEASFLVPEGFSDYTQFLRLIYSNIRLQFLYRPELQPQMFRYEARSGSWVPLVIRTNLGIMGIIPSLEKNPTKNTLGSADHFLRKYPSSKVIILHPEKSGIQMLGKRLLTAPALMFL